MRKKLPVIVFLFASVFSSLLVKGQADSITKHPKLMLGISIPHIFNKGLKLDVIVPVRPKLHAYLSPEYYSGVLEYSEQGNVKGYGFQAGGRYVFWTELKTEKLSMAFTQVSVGYNHFRIETEDQFWVEKQMNNQTVLVQETGPVFKEYNRASLDLLLGMIWKQRTGFYFEWNFGISVREVKSKFMENYTPSYLNDDYTWSYGRSGVLPTLGMRVGFVLD